jgi:hypothetical protein
LPDLVLSKEKSAAAAKKGTRKGLNALLKAAKSKDKSEQERLQRQRRN